MKFVAYLPRFLNFGVALSAILLFSASVPAQAADFDLVPLPVSVEDQSADGKHFTSFEFIKSEAGNPDAARAAKYFQSELKKKNGAVPRMFTKHSAGTLVFQKLKNPEAVKNNPEGYVIDATEENCVAVEALTYAGFVNASQTLLQLVASEKPWMHKIPRCRIVDYPRFAWRGFMLDSVRHYQSPEWIKKLIDVLASQKINTLHWHLTDDQGWRIEIKKYPELTQKAGWRKDIGFSLPANASTHYDENGRYGGFYSQEQIRDIIRYAAERNITIVPEIELPGHAVAALTVFPELGCTNGPYEIRLIGGVADDVYCAGNEKTYAFLEDVIGEVAALFPGTFFHVGGDECPKIRWRKCPKCQAKIKAEGLRNEHELQSYVIRRMEKFLAGKGKRLIGWDEILEGGLAPNATVMSWRGASGGIAAAKMGHDVVMTPNSHCYFDYSQARTGEPRSIGGFIPLERAYKFDPTEGVPEAFHRHVLGGQANLWTEYIPNESHAEYMIAPRISALAEVTWTPPERKNWDAFQDRMLAQYRRFEKAGVNYRKPDGVLIRAVPGGVAFSPDLKNAAVVYTLDGSEPTHESARAGADNYRVKIPAASGIVHVRACAVLPDGKLGRISERMLNLPKARVVSTLGTSETNFPERAVDGSRASIYWADRVVYVGDTVSAFFETPQDAKILRCVTGKNDNGGGGDRLQHGVLEILEEGKDWREVATFKDGVATVELPAGTRFIAVRLRATGSQNEWLVVREFEFLKK